MIGALSGGKQVMAREMFNPNLALFKKVPDRASTFQPNPTSYVQNDEARGTNHLDFFKFVGRVIGKALFDGQCIEAYFTRSFYKHMLDQPLTYQAMPDFVLSTPLCSSCRSLYPCFLLLFLPLSCLSVRFTTFPFLEVVKVRTEVPR